MQVITKVTCREDIPTNTSCASRRWSTATNSFALFGCWETLKLVPEHDSAKLGDTTTDTNNSFMLLDWLQLQLEAGYGIPVVHYGKKGKRCIEGKGLSSISFSFHQGSPSDHHDKPKKKITDLFFLW